MHVLDLTTDLGIPVMAAVSSRNDGGGVALGFGANLNPDAALRRAVLELQQMAAVCDAAKDSPPDDGTSTDFARALHDWLGSINLGEQLWLQPSATAGHAAWCAQDSQPCLASCLSILDRLGLDLLVANLTRPDVQVPVVRAIVPGLRSARARFASGRLYDVPCALGWLASPLAETELNPVPFFL